MVKKPKTFISEIVPKGIRRAAKQKAPTLGQLFSAAMIPGAAVRLSRPPGPRPFVPPKGKRRGR
jgi:hypothetical protein